MKAQKKIWFLAAGMAILLVIVCLNRYMLRQSPFQSDYTFEAVSEVSYGADGTMFAIEGGKKELLVLNEAGEITRRILGGSEARVFYYATRVCQDAEKNIYIADINYGKQGNRIQKERIIRIHENEREVVFERDYTKEENPPLQYGRIIDMQEQDGQIYFMMQEDDSLFLYRFSKTQVPEVIRRVPCTYYLNDAAYDVFTDTVVISTRQGELYSYSAKDTEWQQMANPGTPQIPLDLCVNRGNVYYTELIGKSIMHVSLENAELPDVVYQGDYIWYRLNVSQDGETLIATDYCGFMQLGSNQTSDEQMQTTEYTEAKMLFYPTVLITWIALLLLIVTIVVCLLVLVVRAIKKKEDKQELYRIIMVAGAAVLVSSVVSYSTITNMLQSQSEAVVTNMTLFAEVMSQQIDADALQTLDGLEDYHSAEYDAIKAPLDEMIEAGYENETYYYYLIYNTDGTNINCLMDYEETTACGYPAYEYGDNEYTTVLEQGIRQQVGDEMSSYGSWVFVLIPIRNEQGEVVAELEVGTSLDQLKANRLEILFENICAVFCGSAVITMLILEGLFALAFFEKRKKLSAGLRDNTQTIPIRTIVFLVFMTDSMQDAFIAILCSRLYESSLSDAFRLLVPVEIAIALPMSMQLLTSALFAVIGGKLVSKWGSKRVLMLGFMAQMTGFLICCLSQGYLGILIGKTWIGVGLGCVYVTANTMAATGSDEKSVATAFADVSAGVLSGVTIGVGLGSIILSLGSYKFIYAIGALFLGVGILMTVCSKNVMLSSVHEKASIGILRFLFNKRVLGFFLLILIPFMMALSYREYFFPLYVEEYGINEVQIGRIYLVCGLLVLYAGPWFSRKLLEKIGARNSIILSSVGMAVNMGVFIVFPSIWSVIIGVVILSIIVSFAYTCQYTYFEQLPEISAYGEGNAMGVYSMFENVGQTLGPVVYGSALLLGQRNGIAIIAVAMFALIILFIVQNGIHRKPMV